MNTLLRSDEVFQFRQTLSPETDRGCALMAASYLDNQLTELLRQRLVDSPKVAADLFENSRPLATFSSRIDLTYMLGLIGPKAHRDLHLIRRIRNDFGHNPNPLSFNDDPIANRCRELYHHGFVSSATPRRLFIQTTLGVTAMIHASLFVTDHFLECDDAIITEETKQKHQDKERQIGEFVAKLFAEADQSDA